MSPIPDKTAWKVDCLIQNWRNLYPYAYPPTNLIRPCLNKVMLDQPELILIAPWWPSQEWFSDLLALSVDCPWPLPISRSLLKQTVPSVSYSSRNPKSSRMEIISGFTQEKGFSKEVSQRISFPTKKSTSGVYENKWVAFQTWCNDHTLDPAACSISDIADFLLYLFEKKKLSVSTIKGYRSCL